MVVKIINKLRLYQNLLYSFFIKSSLKKCGKKFHIEYPIRAHGAENIEIGDNFSSFGRLRIEAFTRHNNNDYKPKIIIGDNVSMNFDCHIGAINSITIGNNVLLASRVFITDHSHGEVNINEFKIPPSQRKLFSKGEVIIKDNAWIGEGVTILPNVIIGKNCIIGSNSVVTKSFPDNCIIGGAPARILKIIE